MVEAETEGPSLGDLDDTPSTGLADVAEESSQGGRGATVTRSQLDALANIALLQVWDEYARELPDDAMSWPIGGVYVRDSDAASLTGDAATNQCATALRLMTAESIYVPRENIFFDQGSGTNIAARSRFQDLLQKASERSFVALGAYVSSRLFRNMEEAIAIKRQFRMQGVELYWLGRPKIDPRNPMAWQAERNAEMFDELHSRQTGWYVGMQKEFLSSQGFPQGPLPEGFVADGWGPRMKGGRPGRAIHWKFNEPLASHIKTGAELYLAGSSFKDLERRSLASEFKGRTPSGRPMGVSWWHQTLTNPKYAGLHVPSVYVGYKPAKDLPQYHVRKRDSVLAPCRLPALISVDDYHKIVATSLSRWKGPKWRPTYHEDITSGILYDADCGHRLHVKQRTHYGREFLRVQCYKKYEHNVEPRSYYIQDSVAELDQLLGTLRLRDRVLLEAVAESLERNEQDLHTVEITPDPRIIELRTAIASLSNPAFEATRAQLVAQLENLESEQRVVPRKASPYRAAIGDLEHWAHVWETATVRQKSDLLKAAGLRMYLRRKATSSRPKKGERTSALVEIRVRDTMFATALAISLGDQVTVRPDLSLEDPAGLWRYADWIDIETANLHRPAIRIPAAQFEALELARAATRLEVAA